MTPIPVSIRKKQGGLSLVELMIAMAIGLFMAAVAAGMYLNMRSSFRYQEDFARLNEAGRFSIEALTRDIRMAGYSGCGSTTDFANVVNGGGSDPFLNFSAPIIGYEGGVSTFPTQLTNAGAISTGSPVPDAIILMGVDSSNELVVQRHNPPSAQIDTSSHTIAAGEILLITDCSHASVFQMTGPNSATKTNVVHNTGTGSPGNCTKYLGASCGSPEKSYQYKPGSSLLRVYSNAYFIAPASSGNGRSLWSMSLIGQTGGVPAANEIVEGVDNMQITYGIDSDADRSANRFVNAGSVSDWSKVVAVRVSLLASTRDDNVSSTAQTYEYNDSSITATDRRVRKVFAETVAVRNRTP